MADYYDFWTKWAESKPQQPKVTIAAAASNPPAAEEVSEFKQRLSSMLGKRLAALSWYSE